jgi:FkbM family methyltransferase
MSKRLIRANVRGGHHLCSLAAKWGMLDVFVQYQLPRGIVFTVPIGHQDYRWDAWDVEMYEPNAIRRLCAIVEGRSGVTLFDCGADIGLFSANFCAASTSIGRILAFEPNGGAFDMLTRNLAALPVEAHALQKAVGNLDGIGALVSPSYDPSNQGRFVVAGEGAVQITRIDSLGRQERHIVLKIDVEGGELAVLEGACRTIREAETVAVLFEANPRVAKRTGQDPLSCARFLAGVRPFEFTIAESGKPLPLDRPLAETGWNANVNIVGSSV